MEDLFDRTRDKWQKSFRYPLYQRFLWVVGIGVLVAAGAWPRSRTMIYHGIRRGNPRAYAVGAGVGALALWCFWVSFRAWQSRILVSPTSIKASYLGQGRERISWEHMDKVIYKWRLLGHTLVFVGTDGALVKFRSSIKGYDKIVEFIRTNAPQHIRDQLDEIFFEEVEDEDEPDAGEPDAGESQQDEGAPTEAESEPEDEAADEKDSAAP